MATASFVLIGSALPYFHNYIDTYDSVVFLNPAFNMHYRNLRKVEYDEVNTDRSAT